MLKENELFLLYLEEITNFCRCMILVRANFVLVETEYEIDYSSQNCTSRLFVDINVFSNIPPTALKYAIVIPRAVFNAGRTFITQTGEIKTIIAEENTNYS